MTKIVLFLFLVLAQTTYGQLGSWISPGDLANPHASISGVRDCTKCHASAKGVPDEKCLHCHVEIQTRLVRQKGFHSKIEGKCVTCHSDHKGKNYDLIGLTRLTFDHDDTGWPLTGSHSKPDCAKCHTLTRDKVTEGGDKQATTYLGASTDCLGCHEDVHHSRVPTFKTCERCHNTARFKPALKKPKFSHNRETDFDLTGAHAKVSCYSCHQKDKWAPLPFAKCTDCHKDPHKGALGDSCETCHNTASWKQEFVKQDKRTKFGDFDHQKTAFPLRGKHSQVACKSCHGEKIGKVAKFKECTDCHNNPHGKQFKSLWSVSKKCEDCHTTQGFDVLKFNHNKQSRFPLTFQHKLVVCNQCHYDKKYRYLTQPAACTDCHKDAHWGQFKNKTCDSCHTQKQFSENSFDHNKDSKFKLEGKHIFVNCDSCHRLGKYKEIKVQCQECHNDFHNKELGNKCETCHNPESFASIKFDHTKDSKFPLSGKHQITLCNQCHLNYKYKLGKELDCNVCHSDPHFGTFGTACTKCHTTETFKITKGFHEFGEFSLAGKHDKLDCQTCHNAQAPVRASPIMCTTCHQDPHAGSFGLQCNTCHSQNIWLPSTFRHNQTGFELSGAHRFVSCNQCHINRVFGGLPSDCNFCHNDTFMTFQSIPQHQAFISSGGTPTCSSCHFTFAWSPTR